MKISRVGIRIIVFIVRMALYVAVIHLTKGMGTMRWYIIGLMIALYLTGLAEGKFID